MSIELVLYLIDMLHTFNKFSGIFLGLSLASIIGVCFLLIINEVENTAEWQQEIHANSKKINIFLLKVLCPVLVLCLTMCIFIPKKETMYAIAFAHYSKQSEIPAKVLKAIEVKLDEVIEGVKK
jgi:hypothetical protein